MKAKDRKKFQAQYELLLRGIGIAVAHSNPDLMVLLEVLINVLVCAAIDYKKGDRKKALTLIDEKIVPLLKERIGLVEPKIIHKEHPTRL